MWTHTAIVKHYMAP